MVRVASALVAFLLAAVVAAPEASAQAADGRLKRIASSKTIKIAHRTDATPFSFVNDKKEVAGYTIDLCKAVVASIEKQIKVQPLKIEWVPVSTQDRFTAVASGKADMECGSSTVTLTRMKQVDFSNITFVESTGVVVRTATGANNIGDLAGKKIAVIAGTTNEQALKVRDQQLKLNATFVPVKDRNEAISVLESGGADAFASDKLLLVGTQFKDPQSMKMLPDDLSIEPYAIALPRNDANLRLAVNAGLAETYRSGEIMTIFTRWFSPIGLRPGILLGASYALGALAE
jgi:ABC-type amino acid transport substrate-binding protein